MSDTEDVIKKAAKEAGLSDAQAAALAKVLGKRVTAVGDAVERAADRVSGAASAFIEHLRRGEATDHPEYWAPKNRGTGHNLTCLITGKTEKFMPSLTGYVKSKAAAERVIKIFNGRARMEERVHMERKPNEYVVQVGVLHEHEAVLGRLLDALYTCECMLSETQVNWAIDPVKYEADEPKALYRIRQQQQEIAALKAGKAA